jgi:hypothetical protein
MPTAKGVGILNNNIDTIQLRDPTIIIKKPRKIYEKAFALKFLKKTGPAINPTDVTKLISPNSLITLGISKPKWQIEEIYYV